ncbi:MAG TPA: trehalose-phosphatase [Rhizomicrobium sp.]|jgi:trehalose 6-phosphate phosphatase|nr:trehalose-phosphatase [Rhizomicrobium sp.]
MTPPVNGSSALFLDIDGTLLDLARTPDAVVVPNELHRTLQRLHEDLRGALAFVSGRSLNSIDRLFAPLRGAAIGCHGAEVRGADGKVLALAPPISDAVRVLFRDLAGSHPGVLLEDKVYTVALHYRLAPEAKPSLMVALGKQAQLFAAENVAVIEGKAVIEARRAEIDKGVGVIALTAQKPFHGRRALFGGDDTTDLDVFRILPGIGGTGFSVGRHYPGVEHVFSSPRAVRQWLSRLAQEGLAA